MKAILVVDVPVLDDGRHLCNECPIWNKERCFCEYDFNMEAKGCPLKPMPQKKEIHNENGYYDLSQLFYEGWNACLEAITGETE